MSRRASLRKDTDYETSFHCAGGTGILREEVWVNAADEVVRYNLAFILPHVTTVDHGRILGFDNAHGVHERHLLGEVQAVRWRGYPETAQRFYREVEAFRRRYEDEGIC